MFINISYYLYFFALFFIFNLVTDRTLAFDSNEHVYLGDCLKLEFDGNEKYRKRSQYSEHYKALANIPKYVGELCPNLKDQEVSMIKLNRKNYCINSLGIIQKLYWIRIK